MGSRIPSDKEPYVGGAWTWHQDYGYWYHDGFLQVLKGSRRLGRINHHLGGDSHQTGVNLEPVEAAKKVPELVYFEMGVGDELIFHSNLLPRSDKTRSPNPRWSLICRYNPAYNSPYKQPATSTIRRLKKFPTTPLKRSARS